MKNGEKESSDLIHCYKLFTNCAKQINLVFYKKNFVFYLQNRMGIDFTALSAETLASVESYLITFIFCTGAIGFRLLKSLIPCGFQRFSMNNFF